MFPRRHVPPGRSRSPPCSAGWRGSGIAITAGVGGSWQNNASSLDSAFQSAPDWGKGKGKGK
eukprot:9589305-Alexandrium_andersonii.AAC.1